MFDRWMLIEVAARHRVDPRTLRRAMREGLDAIHGDYVRARAARALTELGYQAGPESNDEPVFCMSDRGAR